MAIWMETFKKKKKKKHWGLPVELGDQLQSSRLSIPEFIEQGREGVSHKIK
jgi:hypothetical protein